MIIHRVIFISLLLASTTATCDSVFDLTLPGINALRNQMKQLNRCIERYIASIEIKAAAEGGDLSSAVNFENGPSGACRLVVAQNSNVASDGTMTIYTPGTTTSGLSIGLTDQTLTFHPFTNTNPLTSYSPMAGVVEIKTWQAQYTPGASSSLDLTQVTILNSKVNMIAQIGQPVSWAAG
jgi:hypothetical protein